MALARLKKLYALNSYCAYCKRPTILNENLPEFWTEIDATIDHKTPTSLGGLNSKANITLACRTCNLIKDDMPPVVWGTFMLNNPRWWEHGRWKTRRPRLSKLVAHNAKTAEKYENQWQRAHREWEALDWPWLKDLTRHRIWSVGWGPWTT